MGDLATVADVRWAERVRRCHELADELDRLAEWSTSFVAEQARGSVATEERDR